ncbi:hypothetical protein F5146DRAFT_918531, partial [Armillaria mellea]
DPEFRQDWANTVGRINRVTSQVAGGSSACSCIQTENHSTQIRFGAPVFEALVNLYYDPTDNILDKVIQTWSVDAEDQAGLDQLKRTHQVNCLKVFDVDDSPVPPHKVSALLKGSLVEVHFFIQHWSIYHNNQPVQHTFNCVINQICVLKQAPPQPSPYKRSIRPYRPRLTAPNPIPTLLMYTDVTPPHTVSTPNPIDSMPNVVASNMSNPLALLPPAVI